MSGPGFGVIVASDVEGEVKEWMGFGCKEGGEARRQGGQLWTHKH